MRARPILFSLAALLPLLLLGCSPTPNTAPAPEKPHPLPRAVKPAPRVEKPQTFELPHDHIWGREVKLGEFRVRAIDRYWAGPETRTLTLEEALDAKVCTIRETGISQSVVAEVTGKQPVLLLTGDLLVGGRQDRLVARSVMLEPGTTVVPVFCAEISRWTAEDAKYDPLFKCDAGSPQADLNVKAAMFQQGTQPAVWSAISQVNGTLDAPDPNGTGAYRHAFEKPKTQTAIDVMVAKGRKVMDTFTVGFAVYRGDGLVAADLFDSTLLLRKVADKLLRGYAMTAVYGDVTNWKIEKTETPAEPDRAPAPKTERPPRTAPGTFDPPPKPLGEFQQDGTLRFECRRQPDAHPIHTGIFRGRAKP
ncbi:MAG: hypothetical protein KDB82_15190 [Planctomycetes bacterium]|nr:hypothetical protein [Planctomycetota bacterium]